MKKIELVYREILYKKEQGSTNVTQAELARTLKISLSTVNHALMPLKRMGAVKIKQRSFDIVDAKKILVYWASIRNFEKELTYKTRAESSIIEIEKNMPADVIFGVFSAYKYIFNDMPSDYSGVYVYSNNLKEIIKRFPPNKNVPNLFVLEKNFTTMTKSHIFVDLWNMKEWYAGEFLKAMENRLYGLLA